MAYNTGFPIGYQPFYPTQPNVYPTQMNVGSTQPTQNNSIIWVQGEAGAKSYMVAPNQTVQLWDSEDQVIYLKSADASGMPSMKILDYKIRNTGMPQERPQSLLNGENYVTKEEFLALREKVENWLKSPLEGGVKNEQSNL